MTVSELVGEIDTNRHHGNLSSAIRLFVLDHFKSRAEGPAGEPRPLYAHHDAIAENHR
jgi:predicted DNA-binding ribbon-helix-helix protein